MSESITVTGFAGLKEIVLCLGDFNLLIGPQATGKSIIAKLLFYCKSVVWQAFTAAENQQSKRDFDRDLIKRFEELFPPQSWGNKAFQIEYKYNDFFVKISRSAGTDDNLEIDYSEFLHEELIRLRRFLKAAQQNPQNENEDFGQREVIFNMRQSLTTNLQQKFGPRASSIQLFIPAGRSFFANLQNSVFSFLSGNNAIDPFLKEFGAFYENTKRSGNYLRTRAEENKAFLDESESIIQEILCGKYVIEKGKDYLDVIDGRRIHLGNCSSGQQETLPLALILKRLPLLRRSNGHTVYIEEPEAHLFPMSQRLILELIALTFNTSSPRLQVLITTHSPYVLTALNNLLQAGALYETLKKTEQVRLAKLVPQSRAIPIASVSAYALTRDGCKSIIDPETKLLSAELIDQVSTDLAIQFDHLIGL
jgi:hypothetical protein